jgi:saccharopine dehydrogenase-like NADP-dependent oxidoreductase
MRVLILGGAGDMGRMAVAILLESDSVSSVTIGDINIEFARQFVELVNNPKLSAIQIDINESAHLIEIMRSHDIILNTVGPFYKFEVPIIKAIIEAKKPFLDICDDWRPTLDALKFDEKLKALDLTAIIGIGASPGITNIMTVYACSKLDEIDDIITAWGINVDIKAGKRPKFYITPRKLRKKLGPPPERANAALQHLLYETLEEVPIYQEGNLIKVKPLKEPVKKFIFPGFKDMYTVHIGHPEPVTLYRTLKANYISNLMYLGKRLTELTVKFSQKIKDKILSLEEATIELDNEFTNLIRKMFTDKELLKEYIGGPPSLSVVVTGKKDGKRKKIGVALGREPFGEMAGETSVPLAIATIMLIEGKITQRGVLTPEEAFKNNPMEFFDMMAPYCGENLKGKDILIVREVEL